MPNIVSHRLLKHLLQLGILLLTGIIAYSNSLNGPFQFDDYAISNKAQLLSMAYSSSSRQVTDLSFLLNHYISGNSVFGFHLLNILIHLSAAVTVYFLVTFVIRAIEGCEPDKTEESDFILKFVPFATALLFVCHPVQTQAVTYIVQRYTSLATLFYLFSTLMFIRARIFHTNGANRFYIWCAGALSVISGLLAMRCKEIAFTLPLMLVVVELFIFHGRLLRNRFFLSGMLLLLLIIPAQRIFLYGFNGIDDLIYSFSHGTREELYYTRRDYLQTQLRVVVTYLRLMLLPVNQNLDYDYPLQKVFFSKPVILSLLLHVGILSSATFMFFQSRMLLNSRKMINGISVRLCSLGIVWFYVALLVESSFIPILDVIFEHRLYLPSTGFLLATASGTAVFLGQRESTRKSAWIALAVIGVIFTTATIRRNTVWSDEFRLWEDTLSKSPDKPRVLNNLATCYISKNIPEKAIAPLLRALNRDPGFIQSLNNLEMVLDRIPQVKGRYNNGVKYLTRDGNVDVRYIKPWFASTRNNLGLLYELKGDWAKALAYYEEAAVLGPKVEAHWINLALLSVQQSNNKRGKEALDKLKQLNPERAKLLELYIWGASRRGMNSFVSTIDSRG